MYLIILYYIYKDIHELEMQLIIEIGVCDLSIDGYYWWVYGLMYIFHHNISRIARLDEQVWEVEITEIQLLFRRFHIYKKASCAKKNEM